MSHLKCESIMYIYPSQWRRALWALPPPPKNVLVGSTDQVCNILVNRLRR